MTKNDMDGLWELLGLFRKDDPHFKNKRLKSAWLLILEPWTPAEVKQAVAEQFREHGYWPDVTDIAVRCPKRCPEAPVSSEMRRTGRCPFSAEELAKYDAEMDEILAWTERSEGTP